MTPRIIAHRGASAYAPENSLVAFNLAWKLGADAIEGDFHLTADGYVVCIHDEDSERTADKKLIVKQSTLEQLQQLDIGKGERIATLEQVLATIPPTSQGIQIEIKCGEEVIAPMLSILQKTTLLNEQIVFICFNKNVIKKVKKQAPQYKAIWLSSFLLENDAITPSLTSVIATLQACTADGLGSCPNIPQHYVNKILEAGYIWNVWTVDDTATAKRLQQWGVASITSNTPDKIKLIQLKTVKN